MVQLVGHFCLNREKQVSKDTNWIFIEFNRYNGDMNKLASHWFHLTIMLTVGALILSVFTSAARAQSVPDPREDGFSNDPVLSETPDAPFTSATSPLTIQSKGDQTNLSVETQLPISPYLGAVKKPTDGLEDISPGSDSRSGNPFKNYHLETGVGLSVNEQTEINLGYRFNNTPSLLDNQSSEDSSQDSGELRFSLEFKLPF